MFPESNGTRLGEYQKDQRTPVTQPAIDQDKDPLYNFMQSGFTGKPGLSSRASVDQNCLQQPQPPSTLPTEEKQHIKI